MDFEKLANDVVNAVLIKLALDPAQGAIAKTPLTSQPPVTAPAPVQAPAPAPAPVSKPDLTTSPYPRQMFKGDTSRHTYGDVNISKELSKGPATRIRDPKPITKFTDQELDTRLKNFNTVPGAVKNYRDDLAEGRAMYPTSNVVGDTDYLKNKYMTQTFTPEGKAVHDVAPVEIGPKPSLPGAAAMVKHVGSHLGPLGKSIPGTYNPELKYTVAIPGHEGELLHRTALEPTLTRTTDPLPGLQPKTVKELDFLGKAHEGFEMTVGEQANRQALGGLAYQPAGLMYNTKNINSSHLPGAPLSDMQLAYQSDNPELVEIVRLTRHNTGELPALDKVLPGTRANRGFFFNDMGKNFGHIDDPGVHQQLKANYSGVDSPMMQGLADKYMNNNPNIPAPPKPKPPVKNMYAHNLR